MIREGRFGPIPVVENPEEAENKKREDARERFKKELEEEYPEDPKKVKEKLEEEMEQADDDEFLNQITEDQISQRKKIEKDFEEERERTQEKIRELDKEIEELKNNEQENQEKIKRLKEEKAEIYKLSLLDSLTEIPNRKFFDKHVVKTFKESQRESEPVSYIFLDIDFFKKVNDGYDHAQGDQVLKEVAQIIKKTLKRPEDEVFRYGGEEFVVILPKTNKASALKVAEDIRKAVESADIIHEYTEVTDDEGNKLNRVTLTAGVHTYEPKNNDPRDKNFIDDQYGRADKALYYGKNEEGRNVVFDYENVPESYDKND